MLMVVMFVLSLEAAQAFRLKVFLHEPSVRTANPPEYPIWLIISTLVMLGFVAGRVINALASSAGSALEAPLAAAVESYAAERSYSLRGLTCGLVGLPIFVLGQWQWGLAIVVASMSFAIGPYVAIQILEFVLLAHGRGRIRFIAALDDAHHRQVLRQVGSLYQFRHAAVQEFLARSTPHEASRDYRSDYMAEASDREGGRQPL